MGKFLSKLSGKILHYKIEKKTRMSFRFALLSFGSIHPNSFGLRLFWLGELFQQIFRFSFFLWLFWLAHYLPLDLVLR